MIWWYVELIHHKASDLFEEAINAIVDRNIKLGKWVSIHRSNLETLIIPCVVETPKGAIRRDWVGVAQIDILFVK